MGWSYESDETDIKIIFAGGLVDMDVVSDAESVIENLPMTEAHEDIADDRVKFQRKIFFGGIW